jgi:hypothetical protein
MKEWASCNNGSGIKVDFTYWLSLTANPAQLVDELDLLMCAQCLNATLKGQIVASIGKLTAANTNGNLNEERLLTALSLIMHSPDYLVQK